MYRIVDEENTPIFIYKEKTIEKGYEDTVHSYDELKIVRIAYGSGIWEVNGQALPVQQGDFLLFSHADIRRIIRIIDSPLMITQINFLPSAVYPRQDCTACFYRRPNGFSNLLSPDISEKHALHACYDRIVQETQSAAPLKNEMILTLLTRLVIMVARCFPAVYPSPVRTPARCQTVQEAISYIEAHLSQPLSLPALAARYYLSPAYFSRIFKAYSGLSLQDYIARSRVSAVIHKIQDGNINILDAALECGFSTSSGFYRTFHAVTGGVPGHFKNKHRDLS